jgi:hypothetical protein
VEFPPGFFLVIFAEPLNFRRREMSAVTPDIRPAARFAAGGHRNGSGRPFLNEAWIVYTCLPRPVYTERLKLTGMRWQRSGMRWQRGGAQTILNLRVLQLSGVWDAAYARVLQELDQPQVRGQQASGKNHGQKAA